MLIANCSNKKYVLAVRAKKLAPVLVKNWFVFWKTGSVVEKSATDFGKMNHRLWENHPPILGK